MCSCSERDIELWSPLVYFPPDAVGHRTSGMQTQLTHKMISVHDRVSILQPPSPWVCVFGRPGSCVLSFSQMRHEAHCWFVYGRVCFPYWTHRNRRT